MGTLLILRRAFIPATTAARDAIDLRSYQSNDAHPLIVQVLSCKLERAAGTNATTIQPCLSSWENASSPSPTLRHILVAAQQAANTPYGDDLGASRPIGLSNANGFLYLYPFPDVAGDTFTYEILVEVSTAPVLP